MEERVAYSVPFHQVPDALLKDERTTVYHIAVFSAIALHANTEHRAWPSLNRLAKMTRSSRSKVATTVAELEEFGWLLRQKRWDSSTNQYASTIYQLQPSLQGSAHDGLGVVHEVDGGSPRGTQEPDPFNHTQLNQTSRAAARVEPESREIPFPDPSPPKPAKQPPAMKDPLQRHIDEAMREVQPYENFARERGQIKTLAARCRRRDAENPEYVADAMIAAFRALRDSGDKWWSTQPFTPSALSSLWERIEAAGGKIAEEMQKHREFQEWLAEG